MSDEAAIRSVIDRYTEGTRSRDLDMLKGVFHDAAVMSGWLGPNMLVGSPAPFFDFVANNEVAPEYASQTTEVWVDGNIATVETREQNLFGMSFVNRFQLVKQGDDTWTITAKLFRHG